MELKLSPKARDEGILSAHQIEVSTGTIIYIVVDWEHPNIDQILTHSKKEWIILRKNGIRTNQGTENTSEIGREDTTTGIEIQAEPLGENKE